MLSIYEISYYKNWCNDFTQEFFTSDKQYAYAFMVHAKCNLI